MWQSRFAARDTGPMGLFGQLGVDLNEVGLLGRQIFFGIDGTDGAFGDAHGAVYALVGVYDQHVLAFTKTIDGADIHAVGVFALYASVTYDMNHSPPSLSSTLLHEWRRL